MRREQQGEDAWGDVWSRVHRTLHRASVCETPTAEDTAQEGGRVEEGGPHAKGMIKCNSGKSNSLCSIVIA